MVFDHQAWRDKNRDKYRASQKRYRKNHRALVTERTRVWANTEIGLKSCRNSQFKRKYGITLDQYEKMLMEQNGQCAICSRKDGDDKRRLFVDHCHRTAKVRGLLCYRCNTGLSSFQENVVFVRKAVAYLGGNSHEALLEAAKIVLMNATTIPDSVMKGLTDTYSVPLDDINGLQKAIAQAEGR